MSKCVNHQCNGSIVSKRDKQADCIVRSSPNADMAKITESGPKNTKPYVNIVSARYALGLTIKQKLRQFPYKRFGLVSNQEMS